jgi:hypothetical protein
MRYDKMAVYFVTGKLGAGKSLMAVGRIKDYLVLVVSR